MICHKPTIIYGWYVIIIAENDNRCHYHCCQCRSHLHCHHPFLLCSLSVLTDTITIINYQNFKDHFHYYSYFPNTDSRGAAKNNVSCMLSLNIEKIQLPTHLKLFASVT